ncbi:T cell receptor alpha chain MC.7.G5-like isoform X2 [Hypomesus transpacificus]|uniref:T cell receptor alpha chain MC.7.G5-like isoform X2 n=1 Tax=Hypomesus transpacificus TaxID=137520 RepID=UPI001F085B91|nr:T cell receptor alpha chain MC.7.G5-like isoform X2 [Hypomesus transpacificus]
MVTLGQVVLLLWECVHVIEVTQSSAILPDSHLKSVAVGDTVTLYCFYQDFTATQFFSWYRQTLGDEPQLVSTVYKYNQKATLHNEFKDNPRFSVQCDKGTNHLTISDVQPSDSAMYFCSKTYVNTLEFADGVFLNVKGPVSNTKEVVQQPVSESIQPGDSVTLNCTIHTETCAGEHNVYWFRHGSGESRPGILYTHGGRSDQCEKSPEAGSPTQSCVYNLPKRNLSLSDAGTYYCAVASCGEILFGNGTTLNIEVSQTTRSISPEYREGQDAENLHYAALNLKKKSKPRRERYKVKRDTVYSGVRE